MPYLNHGCVQCPIFIFRSEFCMLLITLLEMIKSLLAQCGVKSYSRHFYFPSFSFLFGHQGYPPYCSSFNHRCPFQLLWLCLKNNFRKVSFVLFVRLCVGWIDKKRGTAEHHRRHCRCAFWSLREFYSLRFLFKNTPHQAYLYNWIYLLEIVIM